MTENEQYQECKATIHLLRSGIPAGEVAEQLGRSIAWVYKWRKRFKAEGWAGLHSRSHAPKRCPKRLSETMRQHICQARSELEAEAAEGTGLRYIGSGPCAPGWQRRGCIPCPARPASSACSTTQR